jgi:F-type H+-transporting ATPase subunit delta
VKISKQSKREAKLLFRSCLVNGLLDEGRVRQIVRQVIAQKPRGYFAMLSHFKRLVRLDVNRHTVRVESAVPLSPPLRADIQQNLTHAYGAGLEFSFAPNTALIGGVRVKIGSDVYDGSVQARLDVLAESF